MHSIITSLILSFLVLFAGISNAHVIENKEEIFLRSVTLDDPRLDDCLDNLARTEGWKTIKAVNSLYCTAVDTLEGVEALTELEEVSIIIGYIYDLSPLALATKLKNLTLEDFLIRDVTALQGLSQLEYLNLGGNPLKEVTPLGELQALKTLYLFEAKIEDISALTSLNNLKLLNVNFNQIHTVGPLEQLKALEALHMTSAFAQDVDSDALILPIGQLKKLKKLSLAGNRIHDVSILKALSELEVIDLAVNQLQDLAFLENKPHLKHIYLDNNLITHWDYLSQLPSLESLSLVNNLFTTIPDSVIQDFAQNMPALKDINLFNNYHLNCLDVAKLVNALPHVNIIIPTHCQ